MKYWNYVTWDDKGNDVVVTLSEDQIITQYYPHWYRMMCEKFDSEYVRKNFIERDCIDDWVVLNWAWEKGEF